MLNKHTEQWRQARDAFRKAATEYGYTSYSSPAARKAADDGIEAVLEALGLTEALEAKQA